MQQRGYKIFKWQRYLVFLAISAETLALESVDCISEVGCYVVAMPENSAWSWRANSEVFVQAKAN